LSSRASAHQARKAHGNAAGERVYIEKNGIKKLIYQTPWYQDGQYSGFIEMALEIPFQMPHFVRGG